MLKYARLAHWSSTYVKPTLISIVPDQLSHVSIVSDQAFLNYLLHYKTASKKVLPVCMCLSGLFGFIKVNHYFIFSYCC